jgi:hypothetical protein
MIDFGGVALVALVVLAVPVALVALVGAASLLRGARCAATAPIGFAPPIIRMSSAYSAISLIVARSCRDGAPVPARGISAA